VKEFEGYDLTNPDIKDEFQGEYDYLCNYDQRIMELSGELLKLNLSQDNYNFYENVLGSYFDMLSN